MLESQSISNVTPATPSATATASRTSLIQAARPSFIRRRAGLNAARAVLGCMSGALGLPASQKRSGARPRGIGTRAKPLFDQQARRATTAQAVAHEDRAPSLALRSPLNRSPIRSGLLGSRLCSPKPAPRVVLKQSAVASRNSRLFGTFNQCPAIPKAPKPQWSDTPEQGAVSPGLRPFLCALFAYVVAGYSASRS